MWSHNSRITAKRFDSRQNLHSNANFFAMTKFENSWIKWFEFTSMTNSKIFQHKDNCVSKIEYEWDANLSKNDSSSKYLARERMSSCMRYVFTEVKTTCCQISETSINDTLELLICNKQNESCWLQRSNMFRSWHRKYLVDWEQIIRFFMLLVDS